MGAFFDAAVFIADGDGRAEVGGAVFHNGQGCLTGNIVHLFLHGLAVDDVRKTDNAFFFADKGFVERIPFGQHIALGHFLTVVDEQACAVGQNVFFAFAALRVHNGELAALAEHQFNAVAVGNGTHAVKDNPARVLGFKLVLFNGARSRTTDVEGTHGKLRARFTNGLGGDDAHGFARVDQMTASKVTPVAKGADAAFGLAGKGRAHGDGGNALVADKLGFLFLDKRVFGHQHGVWIIGIKHGVEQHTANDALGQRGFDVAAVLEVGQFDAVHSAAVVFADYNVLHNVNEAAGKVTRVGCFKSRIGQTLTSTVGGGEVLQHREAFAERRRDRRFNDFTRGLGHQTAHAGQLTHLVLVTTSARIGHHKDRVEALVFFLLAGFGVGKHVVGYFLDHLRRDVLRGLGPHIDHLVVLFSTGDDTVAVLMFDVVNLCLRGSQNVLFAFRNGEVFHADGHARPGGEFVTHVLEAVAQNDRGLDAAVAVGRAHKAGNVLLGQHAVDMIKAQLFGQNVAHQHAAGGCVVHHAVGHAHLDAGVQRNLPAVVSCFHFPRGAEGHAFAQLKAALGGHVVQTKHDILRRHDNGATVGG